MYFGKLYYTGIFPFLTNKKEIKPRSNIFKIDSVVSTKLSPDSSFIELLGRDSPLVEIDFFFFFNSSKLVSSLLINVEIEDYPILSLRLISTTIFSIVRTSFWTVVFNHIGGFSNTRIEFIFTSGTI
jgi:hypothetical protein